MKTTVNLSVLPFALLLLCLIQGCKTTEANYRAAYEKAVSARESDERETIYGGASRQLGSKIMVEKGDTAEIMIKHVSPVVASGAKAPEVKKIMLVVGEFKQLFNAESMCKRFVDAGYPTALVVQTAEPYYYIVADSFDTIKEANASLDAIKNNAPFPLKTPAPFLLRDPRK